MSRAFKVYPFEREQLTLPQIRERFLPAYPVKFIRRALDAGATTRAQVIARDRVVDARIVEGRKRGRENAKVRNGFNPNRGIDP